MEKSPPESLFNFEGRGWRVFTLGEVYSLYGGKKRRLFDLEIAGTFDRPDEEFRLATNALTLFAQSRELKVPQSIPGSRSSSEEDRALASLLKTGEFGSDYSRVCEAMKQSLPLQPKRRLSILLPGTLIGYWTTLHVTTQSSKRPLKIGIRWSEEKKIVSISCDDTLAMIGAIKEMGIKPTGK